MLVRGFAPAALVARAANGAVRQILHRHETATRYLRPVTGGARKHGVTLSEIAKLLGLRVRLVAQLNTIGRDEPHAGATWGCGDGGGCRLRALHFRHLRRLRAGMALFRHFCRFFQWLRGRIGLCFCLGMGRCRWRLGLGVSGWRLGLVERRGWRFCGRRRVGR